MKPKTSRIALKSAYRTNTQKRAHASIPRITNGPKTINDRPASTTTSRSTYRTTTVIDLLASRKEWIARALVSHAPPKA